jgi:hypothetical protein
MPFTYHHFSIIWSLRGSLCSHHIYNRDRISQTFHIKLSHFHAFTDDTLLAFIRARIGPDSGAVARLASVTVNMHRERTLDVAAELHKDVVNGLQLSLEYSALPDSGKFSPWEFAEEEDLDLIL